MTTNYIEIFRVFPELLFEIIVAPLFLILTCHLDNWIKKVYQHYTVLLILEKKDERLYIATHENICIDEAIYLEDIAYFFVAVGLNRHLDGTVEKIDGSTRQCYRLCVKLKNKKIRHLKNSGSGYELFDLDETYFKNYVFKNTRVHRLADYLNLMLKEPFTRNLEKFAALQKTKNNE